ncbi:lysophospholipase [Flavobacteriaceae bacterium]|nr:lysophospholipase [Flavobacteriaceae bacterium]
MGGNAVINYALKKTTHLQGIIATSPFLKLAFEPPKIKLALGKLLQKIAPSVTLGNEINPNDISREKIEVERYINDPLIHSKISPNFSLTFIDSGKWAIENASQLTIPILVLHGTGDKIIDYRGTQKFAENAKRATLKLYENGYHELQNDLCRNEMLVDVVNWISSQL